MMDRWAVSTVDSTMQLAPSVASAPHVAVRLAYDRLVALGFAAWVVIEGLLLDQDASATAVVGWALAMTLPLAWRRSHPVAVAVAIVAASAVGAAVGPAT